MVEINRFISFFEQKCGEGLRDGKGGRSYGLSYCRFFVRQRRRLFCGFFQLDRDRDDCTTSEPSGPTFPSPGERRTLLTRIIGSSASGEQLRQRGFGLG